MPKLEALCNCPYGVGVQPKGAHFDATEGDAKILVAIGRARRVADPVAPVVVVEATVEDAPKADPVPVVVNHAEPEPARVKRPYRRRDMTAEN